MVRAVLTERDKWMAALMLDPETGLDPPGAKVRAAQGLDAGMCIFRTQLPVADVTTRSFHLHSRLLDLGKGH